MKTFGKLSRFLIVVIAMCLTASAAYSDSPQESPISGGPLPPAAAAHDVAHPNCCPKPPQKQVITDVVVLIDSTASMGWYASNQTRLGLAQWCALDVADEVPDGLPAAYVKLEDTASTIRQLTPLIGDERTKLRTSVMQLRAVGGDNWKKNEGTLNKLFEEAKQLLQPSSSTVPLIVLVTDGHDCDPFGAASPLRDLRERFGEERLHFELFGICDSGEVSNKLSELARQAGKNGHFSNIKSYQDLPSALTQARALLTAVRAQQEAERKWCLTALKCCEDGRDLLRREIARLLLDNDRLRKELLILAGEIEALRKENARLNMDNDALKREIARLLCDIELLRKENEKLNFENDGLRKENARLNADNDQLRKENFKLNCEVEVLRKENDHLRREIAKLACEIELLRKDNEQLTRENVRLKAENERLINDNARLTTDNLGLTNENGRLKNDNLSLTKENTKLTGDNVQLRGDIDRISIEKRHVEYSRAFLAICFGCVVVAVIFLLFWLQCCSAEKSYIRADAARLDAEVKGTIREMAANKKDCCGCPPAVVYGPGPVYGPVSGPTTPNGPVVTATGEPTVTPITPSTPTPANAAGGPAGPAATGPAAGGPAGPAATGPAAAGPAAAAGPTTTGQTAAGPSAAGPAAAGPAVAGAAATGPAVAGGSTSSAGGGGSSSGGGKGGLI